MRGLNFVPLIAALLLAGIILVIKDPDVDRSRNSAVILLSELVVIADLIVAAIACFFKVYRFERFVKLSFAVTLLCMILLMLTCAPNLSVRGVFSQLSSEQK